ncbi:MAG: hypothetical protein IKS24_05895 [Bacteroidaceae bacterium]|nr:hypothetical protein [Bacteroidaceae bacterium]
MAQIKQIGPGRKTTGTIDGVTYVTRNGKTYVRSTPTMPASVYNTTEARIRQAIFKMIQMHIKHHLRTIRQTISNKSGSPSNRYFSLNYKALSQALQAMAKLSVEGQDVTITDIEQAISDYAAQHPTSIKIASKSGYADVYLTGPWPDTITLSAFAGDQTVIIIVAENGTQTTINADGTITTSGNSGGSSGSGSTDSGNTGNTGGNTGGGGNNPGGDGGGDNNGGGDDI